MIGVCVPCTAGVYSSARRVVWAVVWLLSRAPVLHLELISVCQGASVTLLRILGGRPRRMPGRCVMVSILRHCALVHPVCGSV